jgi:hypothetical protein
VLRLLITANVVTCSLILVTLMMDSIRSSETSIITNATRRNIAEGGILNSHSRENLISYMFERQRCLDKCTCYAVLRSLWFQLSTSCALLVVSLIHLNFTQLNMPEPVSSGFVLGLKYDLALYALVYTLYIYPP